MTQKQKVIVIFDTNMLMLSAQKPLDIFLEVERILNMAYTPAVLSTTIRELLTLTEKGRPKERMESKLALELAKRCQVIEVNSSVSADVSIIEYTRKNRKVIVATNDSELRRKLRRMGVPVIYLRGYDHLELEGEIY